MQDGWIMVYQADEEYKGEIVKQLLENNNLHPVLLDHKDDEFRIGSVEIYVSPLEAEAAQKVIAQNQTKE
ncbi:MAG: hypothetical protein KDC80_25035 [Saprospiraceae bacterium]|nr:hypothetical protein [Saprospiraceae bacterium]